MSDQTTSHRSNVGPEYLFDVMAASQFNILTKEGLRAKHKVLDIGCGCLRLGRLLIPFLDKGCYCGVEPDKDSLDAGVKYEVGSSLMELRAPRFIIGRGNGYIDFEEEFDFIMCQSVFTHVPLAEVKRIMHNAARVSKQGTKFLFTFLVGSCDYTGDAPYVQYGIRYKRSTMLGMIENAGFTVFSVDGDLHPAGQTWVKCLMEGE